MFRIQPKGSPQAYKTYALFQPKKTHTRVATCQEVECDAYANGWKTIVDVSTKLGQKQANYIRLHSGRSFSVTYQTATLIHFVFKPGQKCFREHRVSLQREPIFKIKGGDWRGNPLSVPTHIVKPQSWVDDFGENQQNVARRIERNG